MNGCESGPALPQTVGLMADSHGRPETIVAALDRFDRSGCEMIFHLGDICDSARPHSAAACVDLLMDAQVMAVRGNNDHSLLAVSSDTATPSIPTRVRRYLAALPLRRMVPGGVLAHALPFDREMGLSCMMAPLDESAVRRATLAFPGRILFRGHSHRPEAVCRDGDRLRWVGFAPGDCLDAKALGVVAVTCGALTRGLCMVWSPPMGLLTCLAI
ncbi:MAG: metallophosphoesterase family protein [Desulfobacterales bacterium]|nr:metallophosphoesterase family protein [Desulfobacterales bacterium]